MRTACVAAAAFVLAAGCGGKQKPAESAAEVAPLDTYALIAGDPSNVHEALALLPHGPQLLDLLARARAGSGGAGTAVAALDPAGRRAVAIGREEPPPGVPHARVRGWTVSSLRPAPVDVVRRAKRRLAEASWYRPASGDVTFQLRGLTVTASRDGDRQTAEESARGGHDAEHALAALIPDDAVAAAVFSAVPRLSFAKQLERGLGVRVADLAALAPHGGVAFLRPGRPVPTVTLLAAGGTLAAARRVVTELDPGAPPAVAATLDGVPLGLVHFGALDLYYGRFDGTLVLTDDPELRLHDVSALSPEGLPGKTSEWLYLAPEQGLPALQSLATLAGTQLSATFQGSVSRLGTVLAYRARGRLVVTVT